MSPADARELAAWIATRRWSAAPAGPTPDTAPTVRSVPLPVEPPVSVTLVELADWHRYQLLATTPSPAPRPPTTPPPSVRGTGTARPAGTPVGPPSPAAPDHADDPAVAGALARFLADEGQARSEDGTVTGHWVPGAARPGDGPTRHLGAEQSNTSLVVGGTHVLKVIRRVRPGPHPEVEIGRHLAAVTPASGPAHPADPAGPLPVAAFAGWYELEEPDGSTTVLGTVHRLVPGAVDGWALTLSALAGDPGGLLARLRTLGGAVARLHGALARPTPAGTAGASTPTDPAGDPTDPARFGAVPLPPHRLDAVAEGIVDALEHLPDEAAADGLASDLSGRGPEVARLARSLVARVGTDTGAGIRHHGDLHLGQTVIGPDGWVILDFEGEPARPLDTRRQRSSPLRDVAGMLRSFAYAAATHRRTGGHALSPGWEPAARAAFLDGYLAAADPVLLPSSAPATRDLLALFELEKVVYEIGYEAAHRPDWLPIPVDGLHRLLGSIPS